MLKDLNLLPVFEALWEERSVTRAGERLGVTQAAISASLKRLRSEYNDKLFTLVDQRMEPTPLANSLSPQFLGALEMIKSTKNFGESFDSLNAKRQFVIRTRDVGEVVCLPPVVQAMKSVAPRIQIKTTFIPLAATIAGLANGSIDLALGVLPALEAGIHKRHLLDQKYVCVMRENHPLSDGELSDSSLEEQNHLLVEYSGSGHAVIERELIRISGRQSIRLRLPQYLSAPHFVLRSDLLWIAPAILVERLAEYFPLVVKELPPLFPDFEVALYWHERYHKDPGNKWLRRFIAENCRPST